MISLPVRGEDGGPWLLKLDPPEFPHLVVNEAFFLERAHAAGLDVARARLVGDADGRQGLLVTRFDRRRQADGAIRALACEDACQVLRRWPADKYNVGAEEVVTALAQVCAARTVALRSLFEQFVFAWLTGNGDLHAKNIAVLATPEGEWRVAPAYDLPCSRVYGDLTMALSVGGRRQGLSRGRWLAFAHDIGLPSRAADAVLEALLARLADLVDRIRDGALPFAQRQVADLVAALRDRRRLVEAGG